MTAASSKSYKIATIPGDGIGREVVPEGIRVAEAAARRFGFSLSWKEFDWSCERYLKTGRMMPDRKSTRLNSSHANISYAVFCLKKKKIRLSSRFAAP